MITVVQGAQWGSEAKGTVAGWLAVRDKPEYAVRTGAINAGHTVYYNGVPYAMQQIPVAWVNPTTTLVIGAGAYIQPETLAREIEWVEKATGDSLRRRLLIDYNAGLHLTEYAEESKAVNRHHAIGATGKGCAEAIVHKIKERNQGYQLFCDWVVNNPKWRYLLDHFKFIDTRYLLARAEENGADIQLEGTQGELLDFHFGPYPFTTSRQTISAAWVAEAGLPLDAEYNVVLVARTYPIRVAGNSGPMPGEITWDIIAERINEKLPQPMIDPRSIDAWRRAVRWVAEQFDTPPTIALQPWSATAYDRERYKEFLSEYAKRALELLDLDTRNDLLKLFEVTTVTRKLRRVAEFDRRQYDYTCRVERPHSTVVTFMNYRLPRLWGKTADDLTLGDYIDIQRELEGMGVTNATAVNLGPLPEHVIVI